MASTCFGTCRGHLWEKNHSKIVCIKLVHLPLPLIALNEGTTCEYRTGKTVDWSGRGETSGFRRLGRTLRLQKVEIPRVSVRSAHECGKVVSPTHQPSLPPRRPVEWTPRPEWLSQWKISMTPSGIKPATFRLVVQCINQLRQSVPKVLSLHLPGRNRENHAKQSQINRSPDRPRVEQKC